MHQPLMSLRRFGAFLRSNAAASARDWQSQSPPARKCPLIPSWTLIDVPTTGSILIYSHFVQTVLTSRLRLVYHVDQLRAGFVSRTERKCDTCKTLEFSTLWFGTRRSKVQILSPRPLSFKS